MKRPHIYKDGHWWICKVPSVLGGNVIYSFVFFKTACRVAKEYYEETQKRHPAVRNLSVD